ncbi:fibronectin type III domain-containing protein [Paenibacillus hexagrammi]|uniref:Fibronectin type III domain-containing protein n=1 Tax=Paenibacillus hexagrammi TaxID=2908839 RepID=A0ABY3SED9_9BACL|nr:fibronectin type III domain-containing protein [Paenibacillus sp. YPD9-1]UJF32362.1 fibronectin type III domain-containing protein [Paenibacillus sp. YPD9-1]
MRDSRATRQLFRMLLASLLVLVLVWPAYLPVASAATNDANMPANRQLHRAVTMADGKVMVTGGNDGMQHTATTMIYNPTLNSWMYGVSMLTARFSHAAVLLHDGRVMVIGGNSFDTGVLNSVEIYNPSTSTWSAAAPLSVLRAAHTAVTLPDGRVLVIGGGNDDGDLASTEIYDPSTNVWSAGPSMPSTRKEFGAALMGDGRVLVSGGTVNGSMSNSALIYDPTSNSWSAAANMPTMRYIHGSTTLEDGRVSVVGGFDPNYTPLTSTVIYDPETDSWISGPTLNVGLIAPEAVLLQTGEVFVAGGAGNSGPSNHSESHRPVPRTSMPKASVAAGAVSPGTNVSLSTFAAGAAIYYTTDGSTPTTASTVYSGPITVNGPVTIKAIANRSDWGSSRLMTAAYTLNIPLTETPTASPAGSEVARGALVTLSTSTNGAVIHYTTDGSTPTSVSTVYDSAIAINAAMTIKAIAVMDGMADSMVMSEAYTLQPTKPDAPGVTGVTPGDGSASIAVTVPSDGGRPITSYTVTSSPDGITASGASSPIDITGLTNGTAYTFTVTATNSVGTSDASEASDSVTPAGKPSSPTVVTAEGGSGEATVTFTAPNDNGGSAIAGYTVTASPGGLTGTGTGSPIKVIGLTNGTSYTFTVTSTNSAATSDSSVPSNAIVPMAVSEAPANVSAIWGNGEATVSFDPPADNGGSSITQYTVTVLPGGRTVTGSGSPIPVTELTNGTAYTFTVTATNAVGTSEASEESSPVTPATVPQAPTNVAASRGDSQATVSFDAPADNGGSAVTSYTVTASPGGRTSTGTGSTINVTGLTNGTAYTFTVTATNAAGTSEVSVPSNGVTPAAVPGVPSGVTVEEGEGEATVGFTPPSNDGGSPITGYTVTVYPDGRTVNGTSSPITVTDLVYGVSYAFKVSATNDAGTSALSALTPDLVLITEPGAPTDVSAAWGNTQAAVSFTPPAFVGGSPITGYTVTVWPGEQTVEGSESPIVVTGLDNGTAYTFTVRAMNAAGSSDASASTESVTPATVPGVPTEVTATASNGKAYVSFKPPVDNGGSSVTQYTVTVLPGGQTVTGTNSPITVTGLTNGTSYTFTVTATNIAGNSEASSESAAVTPRARSSSAAAAPVAPSEPSADVLVNGSRESAGKLITSEVNGRKVTTVEVDEAKLKAKLDIQTKGAVITIPVVTKSDVVSGELNGRMVRSMEDKSAVVEIKTETSSYSLPAQQINIGSMAEKFGEGVELQDIKVRIEIGAPKEDTAKVVEQLAGSGDLQLVVPAVEFNVSGTFKDKTVTIDRFNAYVERTIAIPDGVDPSKITTGVVIEENGTVRHVPTKIVKLDGRYYAQINSLTNSTYSVVWHPVAFADVKGHWAEAAINDMGSRMVINGVDDRTFLPEQNITRAEFAAMLVRALGLKPNASRASFADVSASSWYSDYVGTAVEYGLVQGFGDGNFQPEATITREQAMVMTAKALRLTNDALPKLSGNQVQAIIAGFGDGGASGDWAAESIALLVDRKLVGGVTGNQLAPKDLITRAQAAMMIQRLLQQAKLI